MAKSKARFLSELLGSTGLVKKSKSALAGADEILDLDVIPSIPNSKLTNASISIAGHSTALGGSVSLDTEDITEHTNYLYYTNARARGAISVSGSTISYDSSTGVITSSANNYVLPTATSSALGGVKIGYSEDGKNYPVELSSGQMYVNVPWVDTNTTYSVGDGGLTQNNFTTTLKNKLDGIAASANNYVLPFTDNSSNWNTAYGWGNHASAGYLTSHQSLAAYAPLASPTFTGTPAAPTATAGTNTTQIATTAYVDSAVSGIVDSAPGTLNTLNELAAALGDDDNFSTTVTNSIATKLPLAGGTLTGTVVFNSAPTFNTAIAMGSTLNVATSIGIAGTTVIDSNRNLTNIGTVSPAGTNSLVLNGNSVYGVTLNHGDTGNSVNSDSLSIIRTSTTGTKRAQIGLRTNDSDGTHHRGHIYGERDTVNYGGKIVIRVRSSASGYDDAIIARYNGDVEFPNGDLKMGSTTFIDSSRNLTNIGTISSGAISSGNVVAGNSSTSAIIRAHYNDGSYMTLEGYGLVMNRGASYIRPSTNGDKDLYIGGADDSLDWRSIYIRSDNGLSLNGSNFIDASRNLNNIGTISSGAITSSGNLVLDGSGYNYIELHSSATNTRKWRFYNGQHWNQDALLIYDQDADSTALTIETGKLGINRGAGSLSHNLDVGGSVAISGTQIIDPSRNLQNIATFDTDVKIPRDHQLLFQDGSSTGYTNIIKSGNYPSQGYTGNNTFWIEYAAKGGHNFIVNTDGGASGTENAYDHFTIWQGAVDGRKLFWVTNSNGHVNSRGSFYPSGQTTNYVDSTRIANWQTAYGWGNHASAGYLTASSTQTKYLRSDSTDTMSVGAGSNEFLTFQNTTSGGVIQLGFQQNDTDGLHHRLYLKTFKSSAGNAAGKVQFIVRGTSGSITSDILELEAGERASWQGNDIFTDAYHPNADNWTTARTVTLAGDLTGNVSINGSQDVTLTAAVVDGSHNHSAANINSGTLALARMPANLASISSTSNDSGIYFRGTNEKISGETYATAFYAYNQNDGFLFLNRDSSDNAKAVFHIGGYNNATSAGYSSEDTVITISRNDGAKASNLATGLSASSYRSQIVKTATQTLFKDTQGVHRFDDNVTVDNTLAADIVNAGSIRLGDDYAEKNFTTPYFTHGTSNLACDLILGNYYINTVLEIEITGGYSNQNTTGLIRRRWYVGQNPNGSVWQSPVVIDETMEGPIVGHLFVSDPFWDSSASTYKIRIYKKNSNGNSYRVLLKNLSNDGADDLVQNSSISGLLTSTSTTSSHSSGTNAKSGYRVAGTSVINASREVNNVTLRGLSTGARLEHGQWHQSSDGYNRFYFANASHTYFRTGSAYIFRDNGDTGRATISADGGLNLRSGGDGHVGGGVALAVSGVTVIDSSRNVTGQSVLVNNQLTVRNSNTNAALHFHTGNDFAGIGFNRNVATGAIYDSGTNAFQLHLQGGLLEVETYNGAGATQADNAWTLDTSGNMKARGGVIGGNAYSPTGTLIGNVASYGSTNAYVSASDEAGRTAFFGVDTSGYAMFGALTNHDAVIRANNSEKLRIQTNGVINIASGGVLAMNGTTVIDASRSINNVVTIAFPASGGSRVMSLNDGSVNFRAAGDHYHKMWYFDGLCFATNEGHGHFRFYAESNTQRNASTGGKTLVFDIDSQNQTVTASGNITAYSDIKLKDDIQPIENALDKVCAIRGVTFTRKDHQDKTKRHMGVIAQEVEAAGLNEVVEYNEEKDVKTVSYGNMVGVLIEAIKEQSAQINAQQEQINQLTKMVNALMEK